MTDNKTRPVTPTSDNKTNSMWKVTDYVNEVDRLQKQLEEIKANADYQIEGRDLEIKSLKSQIEKMKSMLDKHRDCWSCDYYNSDIAIEPCQSCHCACNWKLKE